LPLRQKDTKEIGKGEQGIRGAGGRKPGEQVIRGLGSRKPENQDNRI